MTNPLPSLPALPCGKRFPNSQTIASRQLTSIELPHFPSKIRKGKRVPALPVHPSCLISGFSLGPWTLDFGPWPLDFGPRRFPHFPDGSAGNKSQPRSCQELTPVRDNFPLPKIRKGKRFPVSPVPCLLPPGPCLPPLSPSEPERRTLSAQQTVR